MIIWQNDWWDIKMKNVENHWPKTSDPWVLLTVSDVLSAVTLQRSLIWALSHIKIIQD